MSWKRPRKLKAGCMAPLSQGDNVNGEFLHRFLLLMKECLCEHSACVKTFVRSVARRSWKRFVCWKALCAIQNPINPHLLLINATLAMMFRPMTYFRCLLQILCQIEPKRCGGHLMKFNLQCRRACIKSAKICRGIRPNRGVKHMLHNWSYAAKPTLNDLRFTKLECDSVY